MRSFAALTLAAVASAVTLPKDELKFEFMKFISEWGKSYGTAEEYAFRFEQFARNHLHIQELSETLTTSTVGHNQFSDWSENEFDRLMGFKGYDLQKERVYGAVQGDPIPAEVDWVKKGAVTGVKNQKSCGSCWSFSATGSMEGANQIETGTLISLSEQQLVDCSKHGNHGCLGGLMDNAFEYAEKTPLETEAEYPYQGFDLHGCEYKSGKGVVGVKTFTDVTPSNAQALHEAIVKQPVSVAIQANKPVFQMYKGGVITSTKCGTKLDHGVLAVGYGTDADGTAYYLVKNSWGPDWGLEGYVKIGVADGDGICGIQMQPSYPETHTAPNNA